MSEKRLFEHNILLLILSRFYITILSNKKEGTKCTSEGSFRLAIFYRKNVTKKRTWKWIIFWRSRCHNFLCPLLVMWSWVFLELRSNYNKKNYFKYLAPISMSISRLIGNSGAYFGRGEFTPVSLLPFNIIKRKLIEYSRWCY